MEDRFASFSELEKEMVNGRDFQINWKLLADSRFLIIAPHGGKIEKGTSEIARAIADVDLSYYSFEGCRNAKNKELHITSHKFDEPIALRLAAKSESLVGIHGREDNGNRETIYLGGLDDMLVANIKRELHRYGFSALVDGHQFSARHPQNICNRGASGSGAQLELPLSFRTKLISSEGLFAKFSAAVRDALPT